MIDPEQILLVELDVVEATADTVFAGGWSSGVVGAGDSAVFSSSVGLQRMVTTLSSARTHWGLTTNTSSNNLIRSISVRKLELIP